MRTLLLAATLVGIVTTAARAERPTGGAGKARGGLEISIRGPERVTAGGAVTMTLVVANTGTRDVEIFKRLDSFTVTLAWPTPSREGCIHPGMATRTIGFARSYPNRGQLAPRRSPLAPGERYEVEVDLAMWSKLGSGPYKAKASFGKATSAVLGFVIEGAPAKGRCDDSTDWERWGARL